MKNERDDFQILFVDDEPEIRSIAFQYLTFHGYRVAVAEDGVAALDMLRAKRFEVMFTDLVMPGMDGLSLLKAVKKEWPDIEVIMLTGYGSIESAIEATKLGCYDYLEKPMKLERLKLMIDRIIEGNRTAEKNRIPESGGAKPPAFDGIVGRSARMKDVFSIISKISSNGPTVLIQGESGTGKELVARVIWRNSCRKGRPFVPINCGAIPEGLAESELFGHAQGAFTGSVRETKGLFEVAEGGTVFLDEVTEISPSMQVKLLRVLQERRIRRVGESKEFPVDVRIIAATNRDPLVSMREGRLREDLFYRLNVVPIVLPPLRERREDIEPLVEHFLRRLERLNKQSRIRVSPDAMEALNRYAWPGNVRELENVVERAFLLGSGYTIQPKDLPPEILQGAEQPGRGSNLNLKNNEVYLLEKALAEADGNKTKAAELLGINLSTLYRKMKKYGIDL